MIACTNLHKIFHTNSIAYLVTRFVRQECSVQLNLRETVTHNVHVISLKWYHKETIDNYGTKSNEL